MRTLRLALALAVALAPPAVLHAQTLTPLLGGQVAYRAVGDWHLLAHLGRGTSEGVLLALGPGADTSTVAAAIVAFPLTGPADYPQLLDSLRLEHERHGAVLQADTVFADGTRGRLWLQESTAAVLVYERLATHVHTAILVRVTMPRDTPTVHDEIPRRLRALDDLLATVHWRDQLIFPAGAQLGIRYF